MYAAPLTELEAVNDMLAVIGQAPVNAFTANNSDQNIARQELAKVVREVCAYGFKFNTDEGHTLLPEIDGTIAILLAHVRRSDGPSPRPYAPSAPDERHVPLGRGQPFMVDQRAGLLPHPLVLHLRRLCPNWRAAMP